MYLNEILTVGKRRKNKIVFHRFLQYFLIDRSAKAKAKAPKWLPSIPSVDLDTRNVSLEIVHDITCCKGGERERERSGNLNNLPIHAKYTYTTAPSARPPACLPIVYRVKQITNLISAVLWLWTNYNQTGKQANTNSIFYAQYEKKNKRKRIRHPYISLSIWLVHNSYL